MRPLALVSGWRVERQAGGLVHVVPVNDIHAHTVDPECRCHPDQDGVYVRVFVHHSADGRERFESLRQM